MRARRSTGSGWVAIAAAVGLSIWTGQRMVERMAAAAAPASPPAWPAEGAALHAAAPVFPPGFGVRRVAIDAGHGAENNAGNTSCMCVAEQDFTLAAARCVGERLEATGHFEVQESRVGDARVPYADRVDDAAAFGAEAFVSLHSDVRGQILRWSPEVGETCPIAGGARGFSVLFSDEGDDGALIDGRRELARAIASSLAGAGFEAYGGNYAGNYDADATPGVFVDRHAPGQRIFVLRHTTMPAVILETHNALDPDEANRWSETETCEAAGDALATALVAALAR